MSKENATRRNRALRKIRKSQHLDLEIKEAIQVVLDLLNPKSGYNVAWPSAATIAKRLKRSPRTGKWYVKILRELGIFRVLNFPPDEAVAYCEEHFGIRPNLSRCGSYGPNFYIVDPTHPLWNTQKELPEEIDHEMGEIVRRIKKQRNARTTSQLSSDPDKRPHRKITFSTPTSYNLVEIRSRLQSQLERLRNYPNKEAVLCSQEEPEWCREIGLASVVRDTNHSVANDTQVL